MGSLIDFIYNGIHDDFETTHAYAEGNGKRMFLWNNSIYSTSCFRIYKNIHSTKIPKKYMEDIKSRCILFQLKHIQNAF